MKLREPGDINPAPPLALPAATRHPLLRLEDYTLLPLADIGADPVLYQSYNQLVPENGLYRRDRELAQSGQGYANVYGLLNQRDRQIVGRTILQRSSCQQQYLGSDMLVAYGQRGRGIGSILLIKEVGQAGIMGFRHLEAAVSRRNPASYERLDKLVAASLAARSFETEQRLPGWRSYQVPTDSLPGKLYAALIQPTARQPILSLPPCPQPQRRRWPAWLKLQP